jgi:hypothetical protein
MQMELHCPFYGKSLWFPIYAKYSINFHLHNMMWSSPKSPKGLSELIVVLVYDSLAISVVLKISDSGCS